MSVGPPTPYQAECERLARETGVLERVAFRGYLPRRELLALYAEAAVAVCPSVYEGFGYGLAQALCAGIPVAAAAAASLPEVANGDALLIDPHDPGAWSAGIGALLAETPAAAVRREAIRARAVARFSREAAARAVASVYASVTGR